MLLSDTERIPYSFAHDPFLTQESDIVTREDIIKNIDKLLRSPGNQGYLVNHILQAMSTLIIKEFDENANKFFEDVPERTRKDMIILLNQSYSIHLNDTPGLTPELINFLKDGYKKVVGSILNK